MRHTRRAFLGGFVGAAAAAALGAACGPTALTPSATTRKYRIGYVKGYGLPPCGGELRDWQSMSWGQVRVNAPSRAPGSSCPESVIVRTLEERGYRVGDNLELTVASPHPGVQDFTLPAAELVARKVDLIITQASNAAVAAKNATTTIPIIVHNIGDVVENGLVPELARPGGNITGVAMRTLDMALKRIELLREAFPGATRPLLVHGPQVSHRRAAGPATEFALRLGLSPLAIEMRADPTEAVTRAKKAIGNGADSLVVIAGTPSPEAILAIVKAHRLPTVFNAEAYMEEGGALNLDIVIDMVAVADYVDRIFRGAKPGDLPILLPTDFELVVNLKAAEALGTPIAPAVVARATKLIR